MIRISLGITIKNFFSGICNFVFNNMNYKYLNNYLPYKNSILEKLGVKVAYNIEQKKNLTEFFFDSLSKYLPMYPE